MKQEKELHISKCWIIFQYTTNAKPMELRKQHKMAIPIWRIKIKINFCWNFFSFQFFFCFLFHFTNNVAKATEGTATENFPIIQAPKAKVNPYIDKVEGKYEVDAMNKPGEMRRNVKVSRETADPYLFEIALQRYVSQMVEINAKKQRTPKKTKILFWGKINWNNFAGIAWIKIYA